MNDQMIKYSYCAGPITNTKLKVIECTVAEFKQMLKIPWRKVNYSMEEMRSMAEKQPTIFNQIKCQSPYIIGGECSTRGRAYLKSIYMLPFDIDHAPAGTTLEDISNRFEHSHYAHTTFSHNVFLDSNGNPLPKFRVWVFLKSPVLPEKFDSVPKIHKHLGESVLPKDWIDSKSYVLSQAMFLPVNFKGQ